MCDVLEQPILNAEFGDTDIIHSAIELSSHTRHKESDQLTVHNTVTCASLRHNARVFKSNGISPTFQLTLDSLPPSISVGAIANNFQRQREMSIVECVSQNEKNRISTRLKSECRQRRSLHTSKKRFKRLVLKNGECNISHVNIKKRKRRFLSDIFTTLVDIKWRYTLLLFVLAFIISWTSFALLWWLICVAQENVNRGANHGVAPRACVLNVNDFSSALLFSIETQHTIGYGHRVVTNDCPEAILLVMVQSCFGVIIQALMTGLVFAKLARPKKRAETLMFSKNALVSKRDGVMTLLFRVGDMRKSQIIEAHIRGILIKKRITFEREILPLEQYDIDFGFQDGRDRLFLVWPIIIEHKIDKHSPFWDISYDNLSNEQFELIVILEGTVESTGMTTQARSSYLPGEIKWGHKFEKLITYQKENGEYQIDYEKFHCSRQIANFPTCSARDLAYQQQVDNMEEKDDNRGDTLSCVFSDEDSSSLTSKRVSRQQQFITGRFQSVTVTEITPPNDSTISSSVVLPSS